MAVADFVLRRLHSCVFNRAVAVAVAIAIEDFVLRVLRSSICNRTLQSGVAISYLFVCRTFEVRQYCSTSTVVCVVKIRIANFLLVHKKGAWRLMSLL